MKSASIRHFFHLCTASLAALSIVGCGSSSSPTVPSLPPAQSNAIARSSAPESVEAQNPIPIRAVYTAGQTPGFPATALATDITPGPQNSMWFVDWGTPAVGKISATGEFAEFTSGLPSRSIPQSIVAGRDGNMWMSDAQGYIDRISPSGVITAFSTKPVAPKASPEGIAVGLNGAVWAIAQGPPNYLVRSDSQGDLSDVPLPYGLRPDGSLASDGQGNLWMMTTRGPHAVMLEYTAAGSFVEHPTGLQTGAVFCCPNLAPKRIVVDGSGNVWYTTTYYVDPLLGGMVIGETMPSGTRLIPLDKVAYPVYPSGITYDGGNIWYTGDDPFQNNGGVWMATSSGVQTPWTIPSSPIGIASDSSGNLWITAEAFDFPSQIVQANVLK